MSPLRRLGRVLTRGSRNETQRIGAILRMESTGGVLLIVAALAAVLAANTPAAPWYFGLRDTVIGPAAIHLNLSMGTWAADGLLAIFFFLVGLELKQEFVAGDLRDPGRAIVPVVAAAGGVLVPAVLFIAVNATNSEALRGWAIPTATDIAFAVAVLSLIGSHLPSALRIFLLTLAVVDDLIAICIIAIAYTTELHWLALAAGIVVIGVFWFLVTSRPKLFATRLWASLGVLVPLGVLAWAMIHASGIHATIAGVLLGFTIPVRRSDGTDGPGLAWIFEHHLRPISAGFAVPVFAFFSAGVSLGGLDGIRASLFDTVTLGILAGLILGKPIGIVTTTYLLTRFSRAELDESVAWIDLVGVGILAGIGFTVSLLVGELSFGLGNTSNDHAKIGILAASVSAAVLAALVLVPRNRHYRKIEAAESSSEPDDQPLS